MARQPIQKHPRLAAKALSLIVVLLDRRTTYSGKRGRALVMAVVFASLARVRARVGW